MKPLHALLVAGLLVLAGLLLWIQQTKGEGSEQPVVAARPSGEISAPVLPEVEGDPVSILEGGSAAQEGDGSAGADRAHSSARLEVRVTWEVDGSPAEGVMLQVRIWHSSSPFVGRTDAGGLWTLDPAPIGEAKVYFDRCHLVAVGDVKEGETTTLVMAIPPAVQVRGVVLDEHDRRVPEADIWLKRDNEPGLVVTRCDADGRFELRDVHHFCLVGARAPGHVPSFLASLGVEPTPEVDLVLRLRGPAAILRGLVLDHEQVPVEGAEVLVGPEQGFPRPEGHSLDRGPPPLWLQTDAKGWFLAEDLPPGELPIAVGAVGHSPWNDWTQIAAGETKDLRIVLDASAEVFGIVRDARGAPVEDARISVVPPYGRPPAIGHAETKSDAQGKFSLRDVPLGEQQIRARKGGVGEDKRTFHVFGGRTYPWDPALGEGLQILGRVVDESGASVEGLHVQAEHERGGPWRAQANVAADGAFVVSNCDDIEHELQVFGRDWKLPALATVQGVYPGPAEVKIAMTTAAAALAVVSGRVIDETGRPPPGVQVNLIPVGQPFGVMAKVDATTGDFAIERVAPGDYNLLAATPERPPVAVPLEDVQGAERRDVGTLHLLPPGIVVAHLVLPPGVDPNGVHCMLRSSNAGLVLSFFEATKPGSLELRSRPVTPGDFLVRVRGSFVVTTDVPVHVKSGGETHVDVAVEKGVRQVVHLVLPYAEQQRFTITIRDAADAVVAEESRDTTPFPDDDVSRGIVDFVLRPGTYEASVTMKGQEVAQSQLEVPDGVDQAPDITLTVP